jgi:2-polyprenyl-6-hydroxyphenyl methylase/3-demethylubiquinone-9 3-methyltransferase
MTSKNTICLWYEGGAVDAANFYAETFPSSAVGAVKRAPGDYPDGKQGNVLTVGFTVVGILALGSTTGRSSSRVKPSLSKSATTTS